MSPNLWKTDPSPWSWRRRWYAAAGRQRRLSRPVISVGNLSMGGRGKTPTVACLARLLLAAGEKPAILSRGYARRRADAGVVVVSDGARILADLDRSGDEPLLLAEELPGAVVCVCEDRVLAGQLAERALGATVHLLDDGFQHLGLARDVDLVLVAPADLHDRPAPFGRLREPVSALRVADAVIVDLGPGEAGAPPSSPAPAPATVPGARLTFALSRTLGSPVPLEADRPWPGTALPVLAVAGIAEPERFTRALAATGIAVARLLAFPDHHAYGRRDLDRIAAAAREAGATVVLTTGKDAVRLRPLRPLPVPVAAVPLEASVEPRDAFRSWLLDRLREARA